MPSVRSIHLVVREGALSGCHATCEDARRSSQPGSSLRDALRASLRTFKRHACECGHVCVEAVWDMHQSQCKLKAQSPGSRLRTVDANHCLENECLSSIGAQPDIPVTPPRHACATASQPVQHEPQLRKVPDPVGKHAGPAPPKALPGALASDEAALTRVRWRGCGCAGGGCGRAGTVVGALAVGGLVSFLGEILGPPL